jgi:hypothetical protein
VIDSGLYLSRSNFLVALNGLVELMHPTKPILVAAPVQLGWKSKDYR